MKNAAFVLLVALLAGVALASPAAANSNWMRDPDAAFAAATRDGKLVLVDLFAEWCGWCKVMDQQVFSTAEFQTWADRFVLLRVDVEDGAAGSDLRDRFNINNLPTLLLLDGARSRVGAVQGFQPLDKLVRAVERELESYGRLAAAADKAIAQGGSAQVLRSLASQFHDRMDGRRAAALFAKLLEDKSVVAPDSFWIRLAQVDAYRIATDFKSAHGELEALRKAARAAEPTLRERIELERFFLARTERDCGAARSALADFAKDYPSSTYLADARRSLKTLKVDGAQCS
ncbi:MAG: thioredoxin family protein [Thermoanaerobaculia bacterium]